MRPEQAMPRAEPHSGDRLAQHRGYAEAAASNAPQRQEIAGHLIRSVLLWGLIVAVIWLAFVYLIYFH